MNVRFLLFAFALWSGAVAIKAARSLRTRTDYTFARWEGLLVAGRSLGPAGTLARFVVGLGACIASLALISGVVPWGPGWLVLLAITAFGFACNLATYFKAWR